MSVHSRRIQLLLPISPPLVMGTSQKRYLESGQTKQKCDPNKTRILLGDWNAGKEDENLPGPNFGVPRDLFIEKRDEHDTWQVVHLLCKSYSRSYSELRPTTVVGGSCNGGTGILRPATVRSKGLRSELVIPSCRMPASTLSVELKTLSWVLLATCSHPRL